VFVVVVIVVVVVVVVVVVSCEGFLGLTSQKSKTVGV